MPFIDKKKSTTFQLLYKNYDDVTYEDERTRGTLALKKVGGKVVRPSPDFEREWGLVPTYNMLEADDTEDCMESDANCIFKDADWNEFDQDWITEMCQKGDDESTAVLDMTRYPTHDAVNTQLERVFNKEMENFDMDYDLEQDDERIQGPLPVDAYEAALDEWIYDTQKLDILDKYDGKDREIGAKMQSTVKFRLPEVVKEHIFHSDEKGVYLTVLQSKRAQSPFVHYHAEKKDAIKTNIQRAQADPEVKETIPLNEDDEAVLDEMFPDKEVNPWDCQTIVSTYSNLENHPEVINDMPVKKIRLSDKTGIPIVDKYPDAEYEPHSDEYDSADDLAERVSLHTSTTSMGRPKDETSDEKRDRKKLVKAGKAMRREQKKMLKCMFKEEKLNQRWELQNAESQKSKMSLGGGISTL
jgi:hypothetical protein